VVDAHILEAKSHGVSGFITTWWGQGSYEDRSFAILLASAEQKDFKVSIYWETAPGSGREQIDGAIADLVYLLSRYGSNRAFLKVDRKPVIFVYVRVMGQVPLASWAMIIEGAPRLEVFCSSPTVISRLSRACSTAFILTTIARSQAVAPP